MPLTLRTPDSMCSGSSGGSYENADSESKAGAGPESDFSQLPGDTGEAGPLARLGAAGLETSWSCSSSSPEDTGFGPCIGAELGTQCLSLKHPPPLPTEPRSGTRLLSCLPLHVPPIPPIPSPLRPTWLCGLLTPPAPDHSSEGSGWPNSRFRS